MESETDFKIIEHKTAPVDWGSKQAESSYPIVFQSSEWASALQHDIRKPFFLEVSNSSDTLCGLVLGWERSVDLAGQKRRVVYIRGGPASIGAYNESVFSLILSYILKKEANLYIIIVPPNTNPTVFGRMGFTPSDAFSTAIINLTSPESAIKAGFRRGARWAIRKAARNNIIIAETKAHTDIKSFYELYLESINRGSEVINEPIEEFKSLEKLLQSSISTLLVAKINGEVAAGNLFLTYLGRVTDMYNAVSTRYMRTQVNTLLQWESMRWAKERSFKSYDLGGISTSAKEGSKYYRITRFKLGFGGDLVTFPTHILEK